MFTFVSGVCVLDVSCRRESSLQVGMFYVTYVSLFRVCTGHFLDVSAKKFKPHAREAIIATLHLAKQNV